MQAERMTACKAVHVFLLVISIFLLGVQCHSPEMNQQKRSDDMTVSLETVVSAQAQKLLALESEVQALKNSITVVSAQAQKVPALEAEILAQKNTITRLNASQGSSFVRWGRSTCPSGTTLLYSGYTAGTYVSHSGGGSNYLCVTKEPVYDNTPLDTFYGVLNGMEYYIPGHHHTDSQCAVCLSARAVTYMLPGTNRCPAGSVAQYRGYLSAEDHTVSAPSEYICLDESPEDREGSLDDRDSGYIEHVRSHCGALPCPPYKESKVVTCIVCSV